MRLTLSFIFGGLGAGSIVAAYLLSLAGGISKGDLILPDVTGGAIALIGLACVWAPGDARLRTPAMLLRPKGSCIAYEGYAALAFVVALAVLAKIPGAATELAVAATAAIFLVCQGNTIRAGKSRTAWRAAETPSLIVIMGLSDGVGLIALLSFIAPPIIRGDTLVPIAGMTLAAMAAYRWRDYSESLAGSPVAADISRVGRPIYGAVHALPFALYLGALMRWPGAHWILPLAGVITIASGAVWMHVLIMRLGRAREFTASPVGL